MVVHAFNPSTREAEAGRFLSSRPARAIKRKIKKQNPKTPKTQNQKTLVVAMELEYLAYCAKAAATLRAKGMVVELYPDIVRLKKALQYANTRGYDRVAIVGSDEFAQQTITFKDMQSGEQHSKSIDSL